MSQSSNPLRLVSWTWQWVHFTQMASTVTGSQSNRAPLGCGGTRDWHHECVVDKSAATVWCYQVNGPKSLRNVSNTLLNLCHEELRQFWRQKGVQPGSSKVYLIKCPVSVCIYIYIYINYNNSCINNRFLLFVILSYPSISARKKMNNYSEYINSEHFFYRIIT